MQTHIVQDTWLIVSAVQNTLIIWFKKCNNDKQNDQTKNQCVLICTSDKSRFLNQKPNKKEI